MNAFDDLIAAERAQGALDAETQRNLNGAPRDLFTPVTPRQARKQTRQARKQAHRGRIASWLMDWDVTR